jgi:hypothetical protein
VLTANGNLTRIIAAFYDSPATVHLQRTREIAPGVFRRWLELKVRGKVFCSVVNTVRISSQRVLRDIRCGKTEVGEAFRLDDRLPFFRLISAEKRPTKLRRTDTPTTPSPSGSYPTPPVAFSPFAEYHISRVYTLASPGVACHVEETFCPGLFQIPSS